MSAQKIHTLILGLGNEMLMDDGIGPKLVKELQDFLPSERFDFLCSLVGGMECIEMMSGYQEVIIIDSIMSGEEAPGSIYDMFYPTNKKTLHLSNAHDVSFDMAVKMSQQLNIPLPERIRIIAVEIIEDRVFGEHLSPVLEKSYKQIFGTIAEMVSIQKVEREIDLLI